MEKHKNSFSAFTISFLAFCLISCHTVWSVAGFASDAQGQSPNFAVNLETGNGALIALGFEYRFTNFKVGPGEIGFGAIGSFDYSQEMVFSEAYDLFFMNGAAFGIYHLMPQGFGSFIVDGRVRLGYSYTMVNSATRQALGLNGFELTPEILVGPWGLYAIASTTIMFSKETVFVPQFGLGYRLRF